MHYSETARNSLQKILAAFEFGTVPAAIAQTVITKRKSPVPSDTWSFTNRLLILFSGTKDARGFRQWEEIGRKIRKGAKAVFILAPCHIQATKAKKKPTPSEEKQEETPGLILVGFRAIPVFRYEDTEGDPLPTNQTPEYLKPEEVPPLWDVAESLGISPEYRTFEPNQDYLGFWAQSRNQMVLCSHDEEVFFHELAHAAHYRTRPDLSEKTEQWQREVVAELTAAVLAALHGRTIEGNAYRYIEHYARKAKRDPFRACMDCIRDVEAVLNLILGKQEDLQAVAA